MLEYLNIFRPEVADPRQAHSFWFGTPYPLVTTIVVYWLSVRVFLPKFMATREAYCLRGVLLVYNFLQIALCLTLLLLFDDAGFNVSYLWKCHPVNFSPTDPAALKMKFACEFTFLMKFIDLIETGFFCLRKKWNQVSFLHVYHHITTLATVFWLCKCFNGGPAVFAVVINTYVHLFMYTYYLLASFGGIVQIKVQKIKPLVTSIQIVQLSCMALNIVLTLFQPTCKFITVYYSTALLNVLFQIGLFRNFYLKNYTKTDDGNLVKKVK